MSTPSQNTPKSKQDVADVLLQSIDPLMEKLIPMIRIYLTDYIINMRRQLLSGDRFLTVRQAARRMGVSVPTIYVWINKELINPVYIEDKIYVSISEVRYARDNYYQPAKATKKAGVKPKLVVESEPVESKLVESKPQPKIEVRNGLPHIVYPEDEGQEDTVEFSR